MSHTVHESPYATPAAILAAGLIIAAAVFAGGGAPVASAQPAPVAKAAGAGCGV